MGRTISGRTVGVASPDGDIKYNYRQFVFGHCRHRRGRFMVSGKGGKFPMDSNIIWYRVLSAL